MLDNKVIVTLVVSSIVSVCIKTPTTTTTMATTEEKAWEAAAAACDGGKGMALEECDPDEPDDMKLVHEALGENDPHAKRRLKRFIRCLKKKIKPHRKCELPDDRQPRKVKSSSKVGSSRAKARMAPKSPPVKEAASSRRGQRSPPKRSVVCVAKDQTGGNSVSSDGETNDSDESSISYGTCFNCDALGPKGIHCDNCIDSGMVCF